MTKWLLAILLLATLCWGQFVPLDQNTNTWGSGGALSGAAQNFPDTKGTITNQFEVVQSGTAGVLTMTVVGCMRGGTCSSTLASSSGNNSQIVTPTTANLNIFDFYKVTVSWTGGDATTKYVVNRTGTVAKLGSAAGSGTVTNTGGALTSNAFVLGAGGNDTKVSTAFTTNGTTTATIGIAGGGNGVLALSGNTSGTATLTAPAVAGTATNPFTASNVFAAPDGTTSAAAYGLTNCAGCGLLLAAASTLGINGTTNINIFAGASHTLFWQFNGTAGNFGFVGNKGQHLVTQAANNDVSGTCTFAATTCTVTFTTAYTSVPSCTVNDRTAAAPVSSAPTTTNVVFTGGTGAGATDVVNYICVGNPN